MQQPHHGDDVWTKLKRDPLQRTLRRHVKGEVRFDDASRAMYATDASIYQIEPLGVVIPKTTEDLRTAVSIAMEQHVAIIPRGGGTSLSGQSIGSGLVIDVSKYLNQILETDVDQAWVRVQPGVVLAQLNRHLETMGFQFGPDVATSDRANLGGMIGNNSAGARSIKYGKTIDHVLEIAVILTDGSLTTFAEVNRPTLNQLLLKEGREGEIYRVVRTVVSRHEAEIRRRFPKILRRVSGYNLDALLPPAPTNLARLIVGSEGTLATVAEAKLKIVRRPKHRGIAVVHFDSLDEAMRSLSAILTTGPSAIELLDQMILELAQRNPQFRGRVDFVEGRPAAIFLVEYSSDDPVDIERGFEELTRGLKGFRIGSLLKTTDPARTESIWNVRKTALPLLFSLPGDRKPVTFVEDTAVDPTRLPEFVARFKEILRRNGTHGSFYGHASVGCLHIRPLLDLRTPEGVRDMARIAEEVVELVREFGGALSGEHGDGIARSVFNRRMFGHEIYEAFCTIKNAFDPRNLMNPGKIVHGPPMTDHLRGHPTVEEEFKTVLSFADEGSPLEIVRGCNGNGLCRREGVGNMCPSFMATHEEQHGPRGRANLLRAAMEGRLEDATPESWATKELADALDLCLMCKACKTECPSSVDIAKLKAEFLSQRKRRGRAPLLDRLLADIPKHSLKASRFAPFSNLIMRSWPARWLMERTLGLDRRRKLPVYHRRTLMDWFRRHPTLLSRPRGKVVLLADCFTNHHEPHVGRDAVSLLEMAGYQVYLAPLWCGRVLISRGFLDEARSLVKANVERLRGYAEDGIPILGIEPSCLLTLTDEWPDLLPGEATTSVALQARLVESWLVERVAPGSDEFPLITEEPMEVLYHGHCHQKAGGAQASSVRAVRTLAGVEPVVLDAGCCGMAGAFGYECSHYDVSVQIFSQRLLPALRRSPNATIVAPGFSCRTQMYDLSRRRAIHPVELIRRRIAKR
ncbi:MAG: FAD-linked oxidase C-terminal domain-containing protein [Planctomycetota bacterium]